MSSSGDIEIPFLVKIIPVFFVLLLIAGLGAAAYHEVPEGSVGVEKTWEATTGTVHDPGQAWTVPLKDEIQRIEIRPRTYTMAKVSDEGKKARDDSISVPTENGVEVGVDVTVRYRVNPDKAVEFVDTWNTIEQSEQRLIRPTVRSALRDEGGAIPTSEIYTKSGRTRLEAAALAELKTETDGAVVIEAVQIREVRLPQSYQNAVKDKEIEKQQVQQKQYELQKAEADKKKAIIEEEARAEQRVIAANASAEEKRIQAEAAADAERIRAEAKAEANTKIANSLTDTLVKYEYYKSLDRTDTVYFTGGDSPMLLKDVDNSNN